MKFLAEVVKAIGGQGDESQTLQIELGVLVDEDLDPKLLHAVLMELRLSNVAPELQRYEIGVDIRGDRFDDKYIVGERAAFLPLEDLADRLDPLRDAWLHREANNR